MRLWSLHPGYLDAKGLVALWREALLAQKVLENRTRGYKNHPQLLRFRQAPDPLGAIGGYLEEVHKESCRRGYSFDAGKIGAASSSAVMTVTKGQIEYERDHLLAKLRIRDSLRHVELIGIPLPDPHPIFRIREGDREAWEKNGADPR